jgi:hypothetical protein
MNDLQSRIKEQLKVSRLPPQEDPAGFVTRLWATESLSEMLGLLEYQDPTVLKQFEFAIQQQRNYIFNKSINRVVAALTGVTEEPAPVITVKQKEVETKKRLVMKKGGNMVEVFSTAKRDELAKDGYIAIALNAKEN